MSVCSFGPNVGRYGMPETRRLEQIEEKEPTETVEAARLRTLNTTVQQKGRRPGGNARGDILHIRLRLSRRTGRRYFTVFQATSRTAAVAGVTRA